MTLSEHQTKPPILDGLAEYLRDIGSTGKFGITAYQWAAEVEAVQAAIRTVGEEE